MTTRKVDPAAARAVPAAEAAAAAVRTVRACRLWRRVGSLVFMAFPFRGE
jgi:hypothetical protein